MVVGILEVTLAVPATNLKEKRSAVKRILNRTRQKFNVAAAEVDELDRSSAAVLGFSAVSNDARFTRSMLDKLLNYIDELYLAEIVDQQITIEHY